MYMADALEIWGWMAFSKDFHSFLVESELVDSLELVLSSLRSGSFAAYSSSSSISVVISSSASVAYYISAPRKLLLARPSLNATLGSSLSRSCSACASVIYSCFSLNSSAFCTYSTCIRFGSRQMKKAGKRQQTICTM